MSKILFVDYDGTLHDTDAKYAVKLDGIYGLSAERVMEVYLRVHRQIVHRSHPDKHDDFLFHQRLICEHLGKPYDEEEARIAARRFQEAQEECWTSPIFFPDALYFLGRAKERHILCLSTGDHAPQKADALERAAGGSLFSYAFDHNDLGLKGGGEYFSNALMSTNSRPEEAIAIGDSLDHDIAAAQNAGIAAVWLNRKGLKLREGSPRPDHEARDLMEVLDYIDSA